MADRLFAAEITSAALLAEADPAVVVEAARIEEDAVLQLKELAALIPAEPVEVDENAPKEEDDAQPEAAEPGENKDDSAE